jgi:hypothetical protein
MTLLLRLPGYEFIFGLRCALNEIVAGSLESVVWGVSLGPVAGNMGILRCSGEGELCWCCRNMMLTLESCN